MNWRSLIIVFICLYWCDSSLAQTDKPIQKHLVFEKPSANNNSENPKSIQSLNQSTILRDCKNSYTMFFQRKPGEPFKLSQNLSWSSDASGDMVAQIQKAALLKKQTVILICADSSQNLSKSEFRKELKDHFEENHQMEVNRVLPRVKMRIR